MKIASIKETQKDELRTALTPDSSKLLVKSNFEINYEKDAGLSSNFINAEYETHNVKILSSSKDVLKDADIIFKVNLADSSEKNTEAQHAKEGAIIIGFMKPYENQKLIEYYAKKNISLMAMELVPRSTLAQSFDALSSQANLIGYRAVLEGAYQYAKAMPMLMTAAGTVTPAKVLVLGAGVAGLQAIATAKRLGASVSAYDVRAAAKEQVESLGAKFMHPDISKDFSGDGGYAKEIDEDFGRRQEEMLNNEISKFDMVITTAQIPGKKAPILITKNMANLMKAGSVIIDIATSSGGNCEISKDGISHNKNGVCVVGFNNFASKIASSASHLYSRNLANLVKYLFKDKNTLDLKDEIVKSMLLTHNGKILFGKK